MAEKPNMKQAERLMMEATSFSGTSVNYRRTTPRYIPEDGTPHNTAVITSNPIHIIFQLTFCITDVSTVLI
jgi:hypothetical protein